MSNYKYNGVELPDINTVWTDKETYPYAYIADVVDSSVSLYGEYMLFLCSEAAVDSSTDSVTVFTTGGTYALYNLSEDATEWSLLEEGDSVHVYYSTMYSVIWANTDLVKSDGTVFLAGESTEEDTTPTITESSGNGYALYNGVKLPKLPEWDKTTYPYTYLFYVDASDIEEGAYTLTFIATSEQVAIGAELEGKMKFNSPFLMGDLSNSQAFCDSYVENGFGDLTVNVWKVEEYTNTECATALPLWANVNVCYADGSTYLPASDPIPLDGMTVIEWDGVTDGLSVCAINEFLYKVTSPVGKTLSVIGYCGENGVIDPDFVFSGDALSSITNTDLESISSWYYGMSQAPYVYDISEEIASAYNSEVTGAALEAGLYFINVAGNSSGYYTYLVAYTPATTEEEGDDEEPTTLEFDLQGFLTGLALGLSGKPLPLAKEVK